MSSIKSEKKGGTKSKIICKYFIQGKCTKGEACPYLHSKVEKPKAITQLECPMYNIGFCKNGRNCQFLHIKKDKYVVEEEEKSEDKNTNLATPIKEEEKNNSANEINKEKECEKETEKEKEGKNKFPVLPLWYLEHYYDKPLTLIFSDLEQKNSPEIIELKKKYGFTNIQPNLPVFPLSNKKSKMNLNMNTLNLNFNNFNMNYAFNNNKTDINNKTNFNIIQNAFGINQLSQLQMGEKKYDKYEKTKNNIEALLNKQDNIFYYLIRCKTSEEIKKSQESNTISLPSFLSEKYKNLDAQKLTIIIIICDDEFQNFSGFAQLKQPLSSEIKEDDTLYKIEWLWRTKLSISKMDHIMNKADNDNSLNDGKNGVEIDKDLGIFCCRYMMKRLSKEEVKEFMEEKKIFDSEKQLLKNLNLVNNNYKKDNTYENKKSEKFEINSPFKNSNRTSNISHTNTISTKYSDYNYNNKYEKEKDKDYKLSGHKRYRNEKSRSRSRSRSRSKNRRDHSEDYSSYKKIKDNKYEDRYNNSQSKYKNYSSNSYYKSNSNKYNSNKRSYPDYKDNNHYHKHKIDDYKRDFSKRKY